MQPGRCRRSTRGPCSRQRCRARCPASRSRCRGRPTRSRIFQSRRTPAPAAPRGSADPRASCSAGAASRRDRVDRPPPMRHDPRPSYSAASAMPGPLRRRGPGLRVGDACACASRFESVATATTTAMPAAMTQYLANRLDAGSRSEFVDRFMGSASGASAWCSVLGPWSWVHGCRGPARTEDPGRRTEDQGR